MYAVAAVVADQVSSLQQPIKRVPASVFSSCSGLNYKIKLVIQKFESLPLAGTSQSARRLRLTIIYCIDLSSFLFRNRGKGGREGLVPACRTLTHPLRHIDRTCA